LAVGRGIADISCLRQYDVWDPFLYRGYDAGSIIDGESGLSKDDVCSSSLDLCHIFHVLDQRKVLTSFIDHAESFLMSSLTDIEDMISLRDRVTGFAVSP
jgi:hypothetical protein